jgi:hypothetical protein
VKKRTTLFAVLFSLASVVQALPGRIRLDCDGVETTRCDVNGCCTVHCTTCTTFFPDGTFVERYGCGPWRCVEAF